MDNIVNYDNSVGRKKSLAVCSMPDEAIVQVRFKKCLL